MANTMIKNNCDKYIFILACENQRLFYLKHMPNVKISYPCNTQYQHSQEMNLGFTLHLLKKKKCTITVRLFVLYVIFNRSQEKENTCCMTFTLLILYNRTIIPYYLQV